MADSFSYDEVQAVLGEMRHTPEAYSQLFATESEETLHYRLDGEWSAVEVVAHLADHDAFERSRRFEVILS